MILSRMKPAVGTGPAAEQQVPTKQIPNLEDFLAKRDYTGAITILEGFPVVTICNYSSKVSEEKIFSIRSSVIHYYPYMPTLRLCHEFDQSSGKGTNMTDQWLGYCAFHLGDYKRALQVYQTLSQSSDPPEDVYVNLACCYFFLGMYPQSEKAVEKALSSRLKVRLLFHLAHKIGDEKKLMDHHQQLQDIIEDQLSLASIHYLRSHYQEAIDIYKRILLDNSTKEFARKSTRKVETQDKELYLLMTHHCTWSQEYLALNVYVALCYYKLDYYDVSQEVLAVYLQKYPDSVIAINLKACNHFRLYNGKAAEAEIKTLMDQSSSTFSFGHDLIRHNMVVFRGGVGALQVLPSLVDVIPEARLNLVIYYLKQEEYQEAFMLVKDLEPSVPQEYILKGVVNVAIGQENGSREHIKVAQQFFQLVGSSASECDTIPGRQCMASSLFLQRQFDDVLLYLSSIKSYYFNDDSFNFNYAQAKAALGHFKEAEETFLLIQNEKLQNDYIYISHLAHCYIMNGKPQSAWELYLKMETSADSFSLLQLLANDCYRMGHFWHAAKAFDMLERLDPNPEYWEGKRGACAGVFQLIVAGKQPKELLSDVIQLLRNTANSQVEAIIRAMKRWAKENRINV